MPPRIGLRSIAGRSNGLERLLTAASPSICPLCSVIPGSRVPRQARQRTAWSTTKRAASTSPLPPGPTTDPRKELAAALTELQKHAANYINLSRLQLALRGLQQQPGHESIRIAVMGFDNGHSGRIAKELLRVILADPLKDEQEWERQLDAHDTARPLLIRIVQRARQQALSAPLQVSRPTLFPELNISSPALDGYNLELLVMDTNISELQPSTTATRLAFEEALLVPTVDIPTSSSGRHTAITTPVHRALLVSDGILGATRAAALPLRCDRDELAAAVDLRAHVDDTSGCPFITVNVAQAAEAVGRLRAGVENAMEYERGWFGSNVAAVRDWLRLDAKDGRAETKMAVKKLVASVLRNARTRIQLEEETTLAAVDTHGSASSVGVLDKALAAWAESAHTELQQRLDETFTSRRWRKLGWWKLFWRVDDVSMLASELVTRQFVPDAERQLVYLSGRIEEARLQGWKDGPRYAAPVVAGEEDSIVPLNSTVGPPGPDSAAIVETAFLPTTQWPEHISFTRSYLLNTTIPALQALAQKLVLQTATTTTLTTSFAGLLCLSSFGAYEAGAAGALGLVWSLGRMQKKWETARDFWQGEVREEGRKAVRAAEESVADVLGKGLGAGGDTIVSQEIRKAKRLIDEAEEILRRLK